MLLGLPGALFVAVALMLPTTCVVLVHWVERRPWRRGFLWRLGTLQGITGLAALGLLIGPGAANSTPTASAGTSTPTPEPGPEANVDLSRGYHAGWALATDRNHRGAPRPRPEALDAMARLHGRGEPPAFAEGFRRGYLAGLGDPNPPRP